jgi:RNA processing factor Prp31
VQASAVLDTLDKDISTFIMRLCLQAIALLDTLDKDVNTFIMRVREWYGWHFPELARIVPDNFQYAKIVMLAKDKSSITEELQAGIQEIVDDEDVAEQACGVLILNLVAHPLCFAPLAEMLLRGSSAGHELMVRAGGSLRTSM